MLFVVSNSTALAPNANNDNDKKLIEPYFDERFYKDKYKEDLEKTGLAAIDHFMQYGWQGDWKTHRDPNGWFNITLYKDRLWPCAGNPFVDFLKQPKSDFSDPFKQVEIFVKDSTELYRAWMASEGFLRLKKCKPVVHLSPARFHKIPDCFVPMINRGLVVQLTNLNDVSFYKSDFIKNPAVYGIDFGQDSHANRHMSVKINTIDYKYIKHDLYQYEWINYFKEGRINPLVINFAYFTDEPLHYCDFGSTTKEYLSFMQRIAPGYDVIHTGLEIGAPNEKIIPGFMYTMYLNAGEGDIPRTKIPGVSFLLSLGMGGGDKSYLDSKLRNYHIRKSLWDRENEITSPRFFYVSLRDKDKFSESYQSRLLPTDSKKWLFQSQYHIVIENCRQRNYITEKLLHPFIALTVPIYIGCPNVSDYFDVRGMLIAENIDEVIKLANSFTPEKYNEMLPYLETNQKKAHEMLGIRDRYVKEFYVGKVV